MATAHISICVHEVRNVYGGRHTDLICKRDNGEIEHEICNESVTDNLVN